MHAYCACVLLVIMHAWMAICLHGTVCVITHILLWMAAQITLKGPEAVSHGRLCERHEHPLVAMVFLVAVGAVIVILGSQECGHSASCEAECRGGLCQ